MKNLIIQFPDITRLELAHTFPRQKTLFQTVFLRLPETCVQHSDVWCVLSHGIQNQELR